MDNESSIIIKEMGNLLATIRKKAHLTQKEVGERLGFSGRSGRVYVSRLEKGGINNPSLWLILKFLTICEKPWSAFFEKLSAIYFDKQHNKIIAQVPTSKLFKKVDRDVAKYTHSIQTKFSQKQQIKPLTQEQKEKMSVDFGKHRAIIEPMENEVQKLLGELNAPLYSNQFYKDFVRECYSAIRKFTMKARTHAPFDKRLDDKTICMQLITAQPDKRCGAATSAVNSKLNQITEKWVQKGLDRAILDRVKNIPIKYFETSNSDKSD